MSWTIDDIGSNSQDLVKMSAALLKASQQNILLFCAAKDVGADHGQNYGYPKKSGAPMFCVGGATASGQKSGNIGKQEVDLLCPESFDPMECEAQNAEIASGSSIATALAVGLAGLLLYCVGMGEDIRGAAERNRGDLQKHETMRTTLLEMVELPEKYFAAPKYFTLGPSACASWQEGGKEVIESVNKHILRYV